MDAGGGQTAHNVYGLNLLKRQAEYYYDAFGVLTEETAHVNNPFRYSGYELFSSGGDLYYLKSRVYDASIARFMQEDTYKGSMSDPLSLNLYAYCINNPIKYFDPNGHASTFVQTRSDGSYWEPMAGKSGAYVDKTTGNVVSTTPEWTTSGSSGSGSSGSSSSGSSSSGGSGGLGGVNFGANEGADWLRTGSGLSFEEFWGVTPYGNEYYNGVVNAGGNSGANIKGLSDTGVWLQGTFIKMSNLINVTVNNIAYNTTQETVSLSQQQQLVFAGLGISPSVLNRYAMLYIQRQYKYYIFYNDNTDKDNGSLWKEDHTTRASKKKQ